MGTGLKEGFTTGTAAAAAARAAVTLLLGGALPQRVDVALPPFVALGSTILPLDLRRLPIAVSGGGLTEEGWAWAAVTKDGGDDPDATHGASLVVHAAKADGPPPGRPRMDGPGPVVSGGIAMYAGPGVGRVTLPGLPVAVGEPAINPEPRRQIAFAAKEAARASGYAGPLRLCISVPDGEERARRTMNARLGILGGISILGTRGTVRPYSHEAWKATISQGLSVASALGLPEVLLCTGRRSERLGLALHPHLPAQAAVQAADYAAYSLRAAAVHGFSRLFWVCFPGKLLKLAQGLEWTHAGSAAADLPLLATLCREAGGDDALVCAVAAMPTAAGALGLMAAAPPVHDAVLRELAGRAMAAMGGWLRDAAGFSRPELVLHVFALDERPLLTLASGGAAASPARSMP